MTLAQVSRVFRRKWRSILGSLVAITLFVGILGSSRGVPAAEVAQSTGTLYEVKSEPGNLIWGELFKPDSAPILTVQSGDMIRMETVSHEGILPDQGDTIEFLTGGGIAETDILPDQACCKGGDGKNRPWPSRYYWPNLC